MRGAVSMALAYNQVGATMLISGFVLSFGKLNYWPLILPMESEERTVVTEDRILYTDALNLMLFTNAVHHVGAYFTEKQCSHDH